MIFPHENVLSCVIVQLSEIVDVLLLLPTAQCSLSQLSGSSAKSRQRSKCTVTVLLTHVPSVFRD